MMSIDIAASLNEHRRNALLSYYLGQYVPNSSNTDLTTLVQTPEDLYEYLLIDPLISNAVPTSRVAQAISSIQQYINGIAMNMEPGYSTQFLDPDQLSQWADGGSQYDIWAGEVELDTYPENYIDPTLRLSQTAYFKELITDLSQKTINSDTAQQAVMNYLNKFEQVANLSIISGYLNGTDQASDTYYFLGKSTTSTAQYYWRSFDMSQNIDNVVSTSAWSQWYPMNTAINEDPLQGIPRLAYFNNRLYLFWYEKTKAGTSDEASSTSTYDKITAYSSYCDFSNNWSAPYALMSVDESDTYCSELFSSEYMNTICMYDQKNNSLNTSLYDGSNTENSTAGYCDFSINRDYWFNLKRVKSASGTSVATPLAQYQWYYLANDTRLSEQHQVQTAYTLGNFYVSRVIANSNEHNDFGATLQLPVLDPDVFSIKADDNGTSWSITGIIPTSDTTQSDSNAWHISCRLKATVSGVDTPIGNCTYDLYTGSPTQLKNVIFSADSTESSGLSFNKLGCICEQGAGQAPSTLLDKTYTLPPSGVVDLSSYSYSISVSSTNSDSVELITYLDDKAASFWTDDVKINEKAAALASPWIFQVWEDKTTGCWQKSSLTAVINQQKPDFTFADPAWTFTLSGLTPDTSTPDNMSCYIAFGYQDNLKKYVYQEYEVDLAKLANIPVSPNITYGENTSNGSAVYLSYSGTFTDNTPILPIRLNTLFAKELINKASAGMQVLLNWNTQLTLEPGITGSIDSSDDYPPLPMDFHGANGIYFWELFFYMPYLVAWRLNQEQHYSDALSWYHYIFDPSARGRDNSSVVGEDVNSQYPEPDYWSVRPLVEQPSDAAQAAVTWFTVDPDALASANPIHYQKAVFMAYITTLIAAADANYRLLTRDGLSLARLQYGQIKDLLGIRPDTLIVNHWLPESLSELADSAYQSTALRQYEVTSAPLPTFAGHYCLSTGVTTSDSFMAPINTQLLGYWNTLDSRLYNLRHQLTIDGQAMAIPLYAPPVNPTVLMEQNVQGGSLTSAVNAVVVSLPPYRFRTMLQKAKEAAGMLSQFGQTLLSYCERGDGADLQEIDQQQLLNISSFTLTLQQNAIDALDNDNTALTQSKIMAQQRRDYYQKLFNNGISYNEQDALNKMNDARLTFLSASPLVIGAGAANMAPNIFGLADGGCLWGAAIAASGQALEISSQGMMMAVQSIETSAGYTRRSDEWQFQVEQAQSEMVCIDKQLNALATRRAGAETALQLAQAQQQNLKSTLTFLTTRFTQSSLYTWLQGQLSALYYQAYDAVLSLSLSAEACCQYEMGDITTRFVQTSAWNDSYRGLLVGETLQLNLQQMESAWLTRNTRRLELTKTVSLKTLLNEQSSDAWSELQNTGEANFSLLESHFDSDYPGHYLRQIKSVTVSLPALIGPYQDVRMTLTQSGSQVLLKADISGVNYLNGEPTGSGSNVMTNPRASQQVAISSGLNDAGLFELNFGDERYLPFEGTGAISSWKIAFPNPTSPEQKTLLASLNDVIMQVHYTALYGGSSFEQAVADTLTK